MIVLHFPSIRVSKKAIALMDSLLEVDVAARIDYQNGRDWPECSWMVWKIPERLEGPGLFKYYVTFCGLGNSGGCSKITSFSFRRPLRVFSGISRIFQEILECFVVVGVVKVYKTGSRNSEKSQNYLKWYLEFLPVK